MPTDPAILGFSNCWYPEAVSTAENRIMAGGLNIRLVAPAYFIATKLEAFFGRGQSDYYGSHDLEDLIAVVDGRPGIVEEIQRATPALGMYLKGWAREIYRAARAGHVLHYVEASDAVCKVQMRKRNQERPEGSKVVTEREFAAITAYFQPPTPEEGFTIERHSAAGT